MNERYEKRFNILDLVFCCLKRWRCLILWGVIFAILLGGYKFYSVMTNDSEGSAANSETSAANVYKYALESQWEQFLKLRDYINDSALMQLDANNLYMSSSVFFIDSESAQDSRTLLELCKTYAEDGSLASQLLDTYGDISASEMQHLISFESEDSVISAGSSDGSNTVVLQTDSDTSRMFTLKIYAQTKSLCEKLGEKTNELVISSVSEIAAGVNAAGEVKNISSSVSECINSSISEYQTNKWNEYLNLFNSIYTMVDKVEDIDDSTFSAVLGDETQSSAASSSNSTKENGVSAKSALKSSIKYIVFGAVLGVLLAAFFIALKYLLNGRMKNITGFEDEYGIPLLAYIAPKQKKKKLFGFIDRWLLRLQMGALAQVTPEEQNKIALSNIKTAAGRAGAAKVMAAGTVSRKCAESFLSSLKEAEPGISFSEYEQIVFDSSALERMEGYDAVVFLERKEVSYTRLIRQEAHLARERGVEILGAVSI